MYMYYIDYFFRLLDRTFSYPTEIHVKDAILPCHCETIYNIKTAMAISEWPNKPVDHLTSISPVCFRSVYLLQMIHHQGYNFKGIEFQTG